MEASDEPAGGGPVGAGGASNVPEGGGAAEPGTAGVPFPPPVAYLAGFLAGVGLDLALGSASLPAAVRIAGGTAGLAVSLLLDAGAMRRFARAGTPAIPFKPTEALVTGGPYRFTRNPMYVGMAALYVGLVFAFTVLWALVFLPLVLVAIDRLVIAREEPYLERLFGREYLDYKQRVRRWL